MCSLHGAAHESGHPQICECGTGWAWPQPLRGVAYLSERTQICGCALTFLIKNGASDTQLAPMLLAATGFQLTEPNRNPAKVVAIWKGGAAERVSFDF